MSISAIHSAAAQQVSPHQVGVAAEPAGHNLRGRKAGHPDVCPGIIEPGDVSGDKLRHRRIPAYTAADGDLLTVEKDRYVRDHLRRLQTELFHTPDGGRFPLVIPGKD